MLNMSRDHQLFYKAYNEFSDYQGGGKPDGGYIHNPAKLYYGYFDPKKCYVYYSAFKFFSPSKLADDGYLCGDSTWSGNFLNWATMTRMDVVRKVLYGGYRRNDPASTGRTILERVSLPMDAHSFAKYYKSSGGSLSPSLSKITPFADTVDGISICNTTVDDKNAWSHSTTQPPLMRVVSGNYSLWAAHERRQCRWKDEQIWEHNGEPNGNNSEITGYLAEPDYPSKPTEAKTDGKLGDLVVRVEVCKPVLLGGEKCQKYPNGNWKPIGLLQEFGEKDQAEFGLLTGSFSNNIQGGILRKNVSSFKNEVDLNTGIFEPSLNGIVGTLNKLRIFGYPYGDGLYRDDPKNPNNSFCAVHTIGLTNGKCMSWGNPIGEMFIESLRYFNGSLKPSDEYGKNSDKIGSDYLKLPHGVTWQDPLAQSKSDVFGKPHCRAINIINFNASVISYDRDNVGPFHDLEPNIVLANYVNAIGRGEGVHDKSGFVGATPTLQNNLCTAKNIEYLSNVEGLCPYAPGYHGSFSLAGAAYWAHTHSLRTAVTTGTQKFKDPNFRVNTYSVALAPGVPRIEVKVGDLPNQKKVIIQPSYRLDDPKPDPRIKADKTCDENPDPKINGTGTLVDFRLISQTTNTAKTKITGEKYLVIWEDSEQGGDYDQDVAGFLKWAVDETEENITVTTDIFTQSTFLRQGFGYSISGTDHDGVHFYSGINGFVFTDPTGGPACTAGNDVKAACGPTRSIPGPGCQRTDAATSRAYKIKGTTAAVLEDPMYWAAKWGGFTVSSDTDKPFDPSKPDDSSKWDNRNADGDLGEDGIPDNYFLVYNPGDLENALRRAFGAIVAKSNAALAVSSSQLITGSSKYVAEFTSEDPISGNVKAFSLKADGYFKSTSDWDIGKKLSDKAPAQRQIITNFGKNGLEFTWAGIGPGYQATLKAALTTKYGLSGATAVKQAEDRAQALVNYLRGDPSNEGKGKGYEWRKRPDDNILGPVVNAAPWVQSRPSALYFDGDFPGYSDFARARMKQSELLWVASNDGMVHAVGADNGNPVISFVPGVLVPRLVEQIESRDGVVPFVDGSPFTGDVQLGKSTKEHPNKNVADWKTYLFGSLGRGGRAFYALDVTAPGNLTAAKAKDIFKWQFTSADDPDLGYVLSDYSIKRSSGQASPIVKLNNGEFAIITGNGYQSTWGKAALMILPVDGPDADGHWAGRYYKILADIRKNKDAAGSNDMNGLSTPTWVDLDNNGTADVVYAGDLKGNLWKFDIRSDSPSNWRVSFSLRGCGDDPTDDKVCNPLFAPRIGGEKLLITAAPEVMLASTAGGHMEGYMVTFGTGASYDEGLFPTRNTNRMYGIWDRLNFEAWDKDGKPLVLPEGVKLRALPRGVFDGELVARVYARQAVSGKVSLESGGDIDYQNPVDTNAKDGWYVNLPESSEMIVSNPIRLAQYVAMVSIRPPAGGPNSCSALPESTLYIVNPVTGLPPMVSSNDALFGKYGEKPVVGISIADQKVSIALDKTIRAVSPGLVSPSGQSVKFRVMGNGDVGEATDIVGKLPDAESRLQWREIPGLRTKR